MSSHPWDDLIPSVDLEIYQKAGYGRTFGFGQNPVLLVIDVEYGFVGAKPKERKIDTLIVTGCTTSGCIRATVVDGYGYKYKVIIPEECVFDRASIPHRANLFDMNAKFADVVKLANVVEYLENNLPL